MDVTLKNFLQVKPGPNSSNDTSRSVCFSAAAAITDTKFSCAHPACTIPVAGSSVRQGGASDLGNQKEKRPFANLSPQSIPEQRQPHVAAARGRIFQPADRSGRGRWCESLSVSHHPIESTKAACSTCRAILRGFFAP